jgi:transcriptional regulator with XRE-family HTH domain
MTPAQLHKARQKLGLTLEQMAAMLGYEGDHRRQMLYDLESGRRTIREPQRRLVEAYLAGYRPDDWPIS